MEAASLDSVTGTVFHNPSLEQLQRAPRLKGREVDPTSQWNYQGICDCLQYHNSNILMFIFVLLVLLPTDRLINQLGMLKY